MDRVLVTVIMNEERQRGLRWISLTPWLAQFMETRDDMAAKAQSAPCSKLLLALAFSKSLIDGQHEAIVHDLAWTTHVSCTPSA